MSVTKCEIKVNVEFFVLKTSRIWKDMVFENHIFYEKVSSIKIISIIITEGKQ